MLNAFFALGGITIRQGQELRLHTFLNDKISPNDLVLILVEESQSDQLRSAVLDLLSS